MRFRIDHIKVPSLQIIIYLVKHIDKYISVYKPFSLNLVIQLSPWTAIINVNQSNNMVLLLLAPTFTQTSVT